jgi:pimeloyl-ACP methyl ester carboxylesterase
VRVGLVAVACGLVVVVALGVLRLAGSASGRGPSAPAIATVYTVTHPQGLLATTGGWAYCTQLLRLAKHVGYTLLCGRYDKDGFLGPGLRRHRRLDWGDPRYLRSLADEIAAVHRTVGGNLILMGISYSGFGIATLASHHPELRPKRLIVIDSFLDLVARRRALSATHPTAREIDAETGGSQEALRQRSVSVDGLARLVMDGTRLTVIWTVSAHEKHEFHGATCDRGASALTLSELAERLGRPVDAWVSKSRLHGNDFWDHQGQIFRGRNPGRTFVFEPNGVIPRGAVCA